ncbi:glutamate racemase [Psychrobacter sp. FDAARGOS_221]|nr:glutamate racemase [Psychrobacter sp. FDAARGOS_221]
MSIHQSSQPLQASNESSFTRSQDIGSQLEQHKSLAQQVSAQSSAAPIGLFDSGVGGLSVYMHLKQALPNERYIYYADTLNVPYGPRSSAEIQQLSLTAVDWLVSAGCKLIVIACNSASAHALQLARQKYPQTPIVGLVPALKPAVLNSVSKSVAVLATKATLDGALLNAVIDDYALPAQVKVIKWFNPDLVPWVEAGMPMHCDTALRLKQQLTQFAEEQVDHLVLGCTHYPFFRDFVIDEVARQNLGITVIDSGAAIANRVKDLLQQQRHQVFNNGQTTAPLMEASEPTSDKQASGLYVNHTNSLMNSTLINGALANSTLNNNNQNATDSHKLSFFVSDPAADLSMVTNLVQRLISR